MFGEFDLRTATFQCLSGYRKLLLQEKCQTEIAESQGIGLGQVRVPKYLFKLVYDQDNNRGWAHWHVNDDATQGLRPISYDELVRRTGIDFLPGVNPSD